MLVWSERPRAARPRWRLGQRSRAWGERIGGTRLDIRRAVLQSFDAGSYCATLQMVGSRQSYLAGVPVSRGIPAEEMLPARECAVLFYDEQNPADGLVLAVR